MRTQVPFRLVGGEQPLIVIPARFNGSGPIDCALDTGASHAMLLPEVGARLGIEAEEIREAKGAGGPVRVQIGKAESVAVGEALVHDVPVLMTGELGRIGEAIGFGLGGNIGFSFLEHFRVVVDYPRQLLTLCSSDEAPEPGTFRAELPFRLAHSSKPLVLLPVKVDEQPFQFAIDTGASTTVISREVARRCEVRSTAMPSMTGGGGAIAAAAALISSLTIDRVRVSNVRVAVADFLDGLAQVTGAPIDGIVGTNVLRRFRVVIDYPRKLLRLD